MSASISPEGFKPKSFWKRPEGTTGMVFLIALLAGGGYLLYTALPFLITLAANTLYLTGMLVVLAAIVYMVLDPKMRALVGYMYRSAMRWITGVFVTIDPIGVLKNYIEDLSKSLNNMSKQIGNLRGQRRKLERIIEENNKNIHQNLQIAQKARNTNMEGQMILKSRKAGRLKESNMKLEDLLKKIVLLERVLKKMYDNSEIMLDDLKDQVSVKEMEYKAIRASHSAMRSAMSIISGQNDSRQMFDMALEAIADDVSQKMGEMERFMDLSSTFMDSIDLQNGVFEEEGFNMLEQWEKESTSLLLGGDKQKMIQEASLSTGILDINEEPERKTKIEGKSDNNYNELFN